METVKPKALIALLLVVDKLERICVKMMAAVWDSKEVEHCGKRGAWELRSRGLMQALGNMKNLCRRKNKK